MLRTVFFLDFLTRAEADGRFSQLRRIVGVLLFDRSRLSSTLNSSTIARMTTQNQSLVYPYSLDRVTERVYLLELASILEVIRWRADELESCAGDVHHGGALVDIPLRRGKSPISGATRLTGAIEAFLAAYARASLILYPSAKRHEARGRHLRAILSIGMFHGDEWLKDRRLRNGWMHLDEDIGTIALERSGEIAEGVVVPKGTPWYAFVETGAIRMVDPDNLTIVLPKRGMWSLRPYFHRCSDLQRTVKVALANPYRWECVDGVCGIAAGWNGQPETWMIRSLGGDACIEVRAESYKELIAAFVRAVAEWRASGAISSEAV
jgi:hypothetical protein